MSLKAKLELASLTDAQVAGLTGLIATSMTGNATFPNPSPTLNNLTALAGDMDGLIAQRDALLQQAKNLTINIRTARNLLEAGLTDEADYVDGIVANLEAADQEGAIVSAGMAVAGTGGTPVGPMPKVTALMATAGDESGAVDLHWNPVRRGLQNYLVEKSSDPAGLTGWGFAANSRKSSATIAGLTTGTRYWFRVTAEGAAGPGPASDTATKVAP